MEPSTPLTFNDKVAAFLADATAELNGQQGLRALVREEARHQWRRALPPLALMLLSAVLILQYPRALLGWFIACLFLYSWNFIFLLIPSRDGNGRPKGMAGGGWKRGWKAIGKLLSKPKLAVEIGLTLFLGRMVPLTIGFTLILGTGLAVLVCLLLNDYTAVAGLAHLIALQVIMIITFYALVNALEPQSQGISAIARSWKRRMGEAKGRGRLASFLVKAAAVGIVVVVAVLFIGAMVLPGFTFLTLLMSLEGLSAWDLLLLIGLFAEQTWLMRSFQSIMSRRMALQLLNVRIDKLEELVERANGLLASGEDELERLSALDALLKEYLSMMVYDLYRLDLLGHLPVYIVGPRKKYALDERVLSHFPG